VHGNARARAGSGLGGGGLRAAGQARRLGFFSTINRNPKSFAFAIVGAEYVLKLLPRGTHEWSRFITPSELAAACRAAQLDVRQMRGMQYNPLTRRYWLDGDTRVNYLVATQRPAA